MKSPPKIVIFGQYKSGTTALFTSLKESLANNPRLLFEPVAYRRRAEDSWRGVLSKTILKLPDDPDPVDYKSFEAFDRKLYIARDPRDWLISMCLFLTQEKRTLWSSDDAVRRIMACLKRKEREPRSVSLAELLELMLSVPPAITLQDAAARAQMLQAWCIQFYEDLQGALLVRYEDFVDGRLGPMERYLNTPVSRSTAVAPEFSHVPRTRGHGDWKNWMTDEDVAFFRPFFQSYISYFGYPEEWSPSESPTIDPVHASGYVARVVDRKRTITNAHPGVRGS